MEVTWNKWERISHDPDWERKTVWALMSLGAEKTGHPLLTEFAAVVKQQDAIASRGVAGRGVAGSSGLDEDSRL